MSLVDDPEAEWKTERQKLRNGIATLAPEDKSREFDEGETIYFLEQLAMDYGPLETGLALGWSPAMIDRFTKDPERAEIISFITEASNESVERAIKGHARAGNSTAMKLWAYNKMGHRGWADRRLVQVTAQSQHEIVLSVRQGLEEKTREMVSLQGPAGIAAIQAAYLGEDEPDEIDIIDAEVLDEDLHAG